MTWRDDIGERLGYFRDSLAKFPPGLMLDLACGSGDFSKAAIEMGWTAVGVDARPENLEFEHPDFTFVEMDVMGYKPEESFDLVACIGIFYHLQEKDQERLVARWKHLPMILDTHTSTTGQDERVGEGNGVRSAWKRSNAFWRTEEHLKEFFEARYKSFERTSPYHMPGRAFWLARP